jgi:hypothetical protein
MMGFNGNGGLNMMNMGFQGFNTKVGFNGFRGL